MSDREHPPPEPARLAARDREIARLVSKANDEYRVGLDEAAAFQRLSRRLEVPERGARWQSGWQGVTLGAVFSVAAGLTLVLGALNEEPSRVALGPELVTSRRASLEEPPGSGAEANLEARAVAKRLASGSVEESETSPVTALEQTEDASEAPSKPLTAARLQVARREPRSEPRSSKDEAEPRPDTAQPQVVAAPALVTPAGPELTEGSGPEFETPRSAARTLEPRTDCSNLLATDARAAEQCYERRASGASGLSAEAALYELARLRRDVLRDPNGALTALDDYRARFPQGSLRNEVGLSRVELLSGLGRSREALDEARALLGSANGKERAAELHVLRGNIFRRDLADFGQAALEYSKAETFGGSFGAEATRLRGLSLEALGDVAGALGAYERYLGGPVQPRQVEVRRRIEALTASQRANAP